MRAGTIQGSNWDRYFELAKVLENHLPEWVNEPEGMAVFNEAIRCEPPEITKQINDAMRRNELARAMYREMKNRFPPVTHVDDAGSPMWSAQQIADHIGVRVEAVEAWRQRAQVETFGLFRYTGAVHRLN